MRLTCLQLLLFVPSAAYAAIGKGVDSGGLAGAVLQMIASLAVVIGIIYLIYYASNRWFKGLAVAKGSGLIRVVETKYLAPKRSLMVVEVAGEYLLLGNGSEGMRLIKKLEGTDGCDGDIPDKSTNQTPEAFLRKFDGMLDNALTGLKAVMENDSREKAAILKKGGKSK